jgi:hypothetical protein
MKMASVLIFLAVVLAAIYIDHNHVRVLPDPLYCAIGAGRTIHSAGGVRPGSWSASGGCSAYRQECVNEWVVTAPSEYCAHGSVWDAISLAYQVRFNTATTTRLQLTPHQLLRNALPESANLPQELIDTLVAKEKKLCDQPNPPNEKACRDFGFRK